MLPTDEAHSVADANPPVHSPPRRRRGRRWLVALGFALVALALGLSLAVVGCRKPAAKPDGPILFEEVGAALGIDVLHDVDPAGHEKLFMPSSVGSGIAVFDFDNDGLLDIYVMHAGGPNGKKNQLFKQMPDGTFKDVSAGSGLDIAGHNLGVAVGDINNDGYPDVVVTQYGAVKLFLNNRDGTFRDITIESGLHNPHWGASASFIDYDRDGWLDLMIVNYVMYDPSLACNDPAGARDFCGPKTFQGTPSRLYRNLGRWGKDGKGDPKEKKFEDVSVKSGIAKLPAPGLGVVCADFNGDGWPDIFVANDGSPNFLWMNQKDGTFKNQAGERGLGVNVMGVAEANMGIGYGDVTGNGRLQDFFVTHLSRETNTIWKQIRPGYWKDWTAESGMDRPRWKATGFGTVLGDFDNSGTLHAAVINGGVERRPPVEGSALGPFWSMYGQRNQLFLNDGKGKFKDISEANDAFCGYMNVGRTLAMGDLRNDGSLWLIAGGINDKVRIFRPMPSKGNWLVVRAFDAPRKRDALGADVFVNAGGRSFVRTAHAGGSFMVSNDPRAHFGLGKIERIDSIEVHWPDGGKEKFEGGAVNRHVRLDKGKGKPVR